MDFLQSLKLPRMYFRFFVHHFQIFLLLIDFSWGPKNIEDSGNSSTSLTFFALYNFFLELSNLVFYLQKFILVNFGLFYDEVDFVLHLLFGMGDLMLLFLVDEVVADVGKPNGSVGRH